MDKQFSRYLDLLRVIAAMLVLLAHVNDPVITGGAIALPSQIGYSAVMIFFVVSGYVISYVATEREFTLLDFSISRVARVYSVVIPALALTVFVDLFFVHVKPLINANELLSGIPRYQYAKFPEYLLIDLLFANNFWWLHHQTAFSNDVYWSMCFEVYYYLLFAFAFYLNGWRRGVLIALVLLVVGPGPILRFPLWLFGVGVYRLQRRFTIPIITARVLFVVTMALLAIDLATDVNLRIDHHLDLLTNGWVGNSFMRRVIGDTLTGLLVACNIFTARSAAWNFGRPGKTFAYFASFTFSLYLMHSPILRFLAGYWHPGAFLMVVTVLASIWLIGQVTEKQKDRLRFFLRQKFAPALLSSPPGPTAPAG